MSQTPASPEQPNPAITTAIIPQGGYVPGGLNKDIVKTVENPKQADDNFPFSAGSNMHEVAQYQNFFTYPLDTYYNVFDAIHYFSDEKNRNRYNYEQQQLIISRIVRAALDFGITIQDVTDRIKV